ncbi:MAG: hypothetical protein D6805_09205 [Planctomycetota bacterium]|nr:MAG: hypothetical protein D6805_09205 [Planctomycetota bacterium]
MNRFFEKRDRFPDYFSFILKVSERKVGGVRGRHYLHSKAGRGSRKFLARKRGLNPLGEFLIFIDIGGIFCYYLKNRDLESRKQANHVELLECRKWWMVGETWGIK